MLTRCSFFRAAVALSEDFSVATPIFKANCTANSTLAEFLGDGSRHASTCEPTCRLCPSSWNTYVVFGIPGILNLVDLSKTPLAQAPNDLPAASYQSRSHRMLQPRMLRCKVPSFLADGLSCDLHDKPM